MKSHKTHSQASRPSEVFFAVPLPADIANCRDTLEIDHMLSRAVRSQGLPELGGHLSYLKRSLTLREAGYVALSDLFLAAHARDMALTQGLIAAEAHARRQISMAFWLWLAFVATSCVTAVKLFQHGGL